MNQSAPDLLKDPPGRLIPMIAVPASIGFVMAMLFNAVDAFYAARLSETAIADFARAVPFYFAVLAIGTGFGRAGTALVGAQAGAGNPERAARVAWAAAAVGGLFAVVLGVVAAALAPRLLEMLSSDVAISTASLDYSRIILLGAPVIVIPMCLSGALIAQGDTIALRNMQAIGLALNIVIDPLLMYGVGPLPEMGVGGLAASTVAIQGIAIGYMYRRLLRSGIGEYFRTARLVRSLTAEYRPVLTQGVPGFVDQITIAVGLFMITWFFAGYGDSSVGAYGLASRVEQLFVVIGFGFNMAAMVLFGVGLGARVRDRLTQVVRWAASRIGIASVVLTAAVWILAPTLASIFTSDPELQGLSSTLIRILAFGLPAHALGSLFASLLAGLQRPFVATAISAARLVLVPAVALSAVRASGGSFNASAWAIALSGIVPAAIGWFVVNRSICEVATERVEPAAREMV